MRHRTWTYGGMLAAGVILAFAGARSAAAAAVTCDPSTGSRAPLDENCCASSALTCTDRAPFIEEGRKNVVLFVMDDHGYCQHGFMQGRCAITDAACGPSTCSTAPWISCTDASDCPPSGCSETPATCNAPPECDAPEPCDDDDDCSGNDICVDALCSPRLECTTPADGSGAANDFVCSRSDLCIGGSCKETGASCQIDADCRDQCVTETNTCVGGTCSFTGEACGPSTPCRAANFCARTPAMCGPNSECDDGYTCTTSSNPLRLHDLSCRYRRPGDEEWEHDRELAPGAGTNPHAVHTPAIDALAREGAVFPRARAGGQTCKPARRVLHTGRALRHTSNAQGNETRQCNDHGDGTDTSVDAPFGCAVNGDCDPYDLNATCDPLLSPAMWLGADAYTVGAGKADAGNGANFNLLSYDAPYIREGGGGTALARFDCASSSSCATSLRTGDIPAAAIVVSTGGKSVEEVMTRIRGTTDGFVPADGLLDAPFLLYFAPELPHASSNQGFFDDIYKPYDTNSDDERHLSRTSHADAIVEALVDELKNTCICGGTAESPAPESLWDHTVFMMSNDHGYLMPQAKNESGFASENAQRNVIIINAPEDRVAQASPRILSEQSQMASSQDVLKTIVDYSGDTQDDFYPLSASLRELAEDGNGAGHLRNVYYGHSGHSGTADGVADDARHYVIPRPGWLGVCGSGNKATTTGGHARPCLTDTDCATTDNPLVNECLRTTAQGENHGRRCANDPTIRCTTDAQCGDCQSGTCAGETYHDLATCSTDADCVPVSVCRPPMIKFVVKNGDVDRVIDLNHNPDEAISGSSDLLSVDASYLGTQNETCPPTGGASASLYNKLFCCLAEYWHLDANGVWAPPDCGCPAELRPWSTDPGQTCPF